MKIPGATFIRKNFEALAFSIGLLILGMMNPETTNGPGFCLLENLGFQYCPGDGLGHSIAFLFRGDIYNAMQANILGPFAILILSSRILHLLYKNNINQQKQI